MKIIEKQNYLDSNSHIFGKHNILKRNHVMTLLLKLFKHINLKPNLNDVIPDSFDLLRHPIVITHQYPLNVSELKIDSNIVVFISFIDKDTYSTTLKVYHRAAKNFSRTRSLDYKLVLGDFHFKLQTIFISSRHHISTVMLCKDKYTGDDVYLSYDNEIGTSLIDMKKNKTKYRVPNEISQGYLISIYMIN